MATKKSQTQRQAELEAEARRRQQSQSNTNKAKANTAPAKGLQTKPGYAPGAVYQAGSPGVPTTPVTPFLTGDQEAMNIQKQGEWRQSVIDIDKALADLETQTGLEQTNLEKSRVQSRDNVRNSSASAGWATSSVQDADLFDIEATARLRREFLQTNLNTARITAQNKKSSIETEKGEWENALNKMRVENAAGISASQSPWIQEPTDGKWVPAAPGSQAITGYAPPKGQGQVPLGSSTNTSPQRADAANKFTQRQKHDRVVAQTRSAGATPY